MNEFACNARGEMSFILKLKQDAIRSSSVDEIATANFTLEV